ncbi:MAG: hypothetical protein GY756_06810 [bacterium]|nr:hypothetical protein [bacterium]
MFGVKKSDSAIGSYNSNHTYNKPLFSSIESKSMNYEGIARNPVIFIHGFLGSTLVDKDSNKNVWGEFVGLERLLRYSSEQMSSLSHPMEFEKPLCKIKDNVVPRHLLTTFDVTIFGMHFHLDAYDNLLDILEEAGYAREDSTISKEKNFNSLFTFYYDWRRDISESAGELHKFILKKKKYIQKQYEKLYGIKDYDVQFDILAHSMGGLVSRYYLRYGNQNLPEDESLPILNWAGKSNIDKLIIIGTPNAGYLDACTELVNGLQLIHHAPTYPPAVVGTFPSYYQMLPFLRTNSVIFSDDGSNVDLFNIQTWKDLKWGLADPNQQKILKILLPKNMSLKEKSATALNHLEKCLKKAKQFTDAMQLQPIDPPDDVAFFLFLGNAVKTSRTAEVNRETGSIKVIKYEAGDGKILTSSALMDEREGQKWSPFLISPIKWQAVIHLEAAHRGIMECPTFEDNILFYLLLAPSKKQEIKRKFLNSLLNTNKNS